MSNKMRAIPREELLRRTEIYSRTIADMVGSTMTADGAYVSLPDETTTNDGATIIAKLKQFSFWNDDIEEMYLSKLMEATEKTDELAGDGTSATVVTTSSLIESIAVEYASGKKQNEVLELLDDAERDFLETLEMEVRPLVSEQDYINLATISTKDKNLGDMIGSAIFNAGQSALMSIQQAVKKSEDYVEVKANYTLPVALTNYGLPEFLTNVDVFIIDSLLTDQDEALRSINRWTRINKKNVLIVASEIDDSAIRFAVSSNQENKAKGLLSLTQLPKLGKYITDREVLEDIAAYTGAEVATKEGYNNNPSKVEEIKKGFLSTFQIEKEQGTIFTNVNPTPECIEQINNLKGKLSLLNTDTQIPEITVTKGRINALEGKAVVIYLYERNDSALETKSFRVQDAVKATQYALGFGYVGGAGLFFQRAKIRSFNPIVKKVCMDYLMNLRRALRIEEKPMFKDDESNSDFMFVTKDGFATQRDVFEEGIIDSAKVIENVIKNSFSIAKEYAKIGTKVYRFEDGQ